MRYIFDLKGAGRGRDLALHGEVVEQAAGGSVRGVHRADEAPRIGQQLAPLRSAHLKEEGAAVDRPFDTTSNFIRNVVW